MLLSSSAGCVFIVLILHRYIHARRKAVSPPKPRPIPNVGVTFHVNRRGTDNAVPTRPALATNMQSLSCDRWLIVRFLVCFAITNLLQVSLVIYHMLNFDRYKVILEQGEPDYSVKSVLDEVAITMPGVSTGLLIFVIFGTTAPFRREYREWLQPCRRRHQGRHGPIMVVPLISVNAANSEVRPEARPDRTRSVGVERIGSIGELSNWSSTSSIWGLPPLDFDDFSDMEGFPTF